MDSNAKVYKHNQVHLIRDNTESTLIQNKDFEQSQDRPIHDLNELIQL